MTLEPLLSAGPAVQIHTLAALLAFGLGIVQLVGVKGRLRHRIVGWIWVGLMLVVAASSLFIHTIRLVGPFSPIHILSLWTLVAVPFAVLAVRRGRIGAHATGMRSTFWFALVVAGLLTLTPGRVLHMVVFG